MHPKSPTSLLTFSEVLSSQVDESLPYGLLKRILRNLKQSHSAYPDRSSSQIHYIQSLSQTQQRSTCTTPAPKTSNIANDVLSETTPTAATKTLNFTPLSEASSRPTPIRCSPPSKLRRKRRRSTRPPIAPFSLESPDVINPPIDTPIKKPRTLFSPTLIPNCNQVGKEINALLDQLATKVDGKAVLWNALREKLVEKSETLYQSFCDSMDRIFDEDDPLTTEIPISSQSSKGCVFYSNSFWEGAWKDFWEEKQRRDRRALAQSGSRKSWRENDTAHDDDDLIQLTQNYMKNMSASP